MSDEKLHAVVVQCRFLSEKGKNIEYLIFGPLLEIKMSKKCMPLWREAQFEAKKYIKRAMFGPFLEVTTSKKYTPLWCETHLQVEGLKISHVRTAFGN